LKNGEPAKAQQQFVAARQLQVRPYGQVTDVDVRLEKTIEQDEAASAGLVERPGQVAECREERRKLDRERNCELGLEILDDLFQAVLDGRSRLIEVGDDFVHVQLERVGACLLDQPGELQPHFRGRAIEGADHRDIDGGFHPTHVLEVFVRAERVHFRFRKVRDDGRELAIQAVHVTDPVGFLLRDLLLEQRVEHDGGAAAVLQAADGIQMIGEW